MLPLFFVRPHLGYRLTHKSEEDLHVILNMADVGMDAPLPPLPGKNWYSVVDTSDGATIGIFPQENQHPVFTMVWRMQPRTVVIFEGR